MRTFDFILLDRSGSMGAVWRPALQAVNSYVSALARHLVPSVVSFSTFSDKGISELRNEKSGRWTTVSETIAGFPGGGTPLYDAIVQTVHNAELRCTAEDRVALVFMTDGDDTCSQTETCDSAGAALSRCRERGWQVIFLGLEGYQIPAAVAKTLGITSQTSATLERDRLTSDLRALASKRAAHHETGAPMLLSGPSSSLS